MRKKFKVLDASTGEKVKLDKSQMIVMNGEGVVFIVNGINDYYTSITKLSNVIPKYDVIWTSENENQE